VQPDALGAVEIVEEVRLDAPVPTLVLGPPRQPQGDGALAGLRPRIVDLQVSVDGAVTQVPGGGVITAPQRLALPPSARSVTMRYRVLGSVARSVPATPGRALVLLSPLSAGGLAPTLPVVVDVDGSTAGEVLNLVCPDLEERAQVCGLAAGSHRYTPALTAGKATVVAQLNLPGPGA
jgi:hypothetical protein